MLEFKQNILYLGYGAVAQCTLPLLLQRVQVNPKKITIIDFEDKKEDLIPFIQKGVTFVRLLLTPENLVSTLSTYLKSGDILIDLAWNIDTLEILEWCHSHNVRYINTSVEVWNPYDHEGKHPTERTLYWRHMRIHDAIEKWKEKGPTMLVEHGANPGLITHMTKQGLLDIAQKALADGHFNVATSKKIVEAVSSRAWNHLAQLLGVKVIHISERDTQITNNPKKVNEFVNTWSIQGFHEEGTTTSELGWGTHEKVLPQGALTHSHGPQNQICLTRMGINTKVRSYVPGSTIEGMVVRHGEAFTLSRLLTVTKKGKADYRPTVHYAYCPCDSAIASLNELRGNHFELQPHCRIMNDEITSGSDILGALLMGHPYQSWWIGSDLSIEESRRLIPHQNATTVQVAIAVVTGIEYLIENPNEGFCTPEDLPHEVILKKAMPYLGQWISTPVEWTPLKGHHESFKGFHSSPLDLSDPWQFSNFLIQD